MLSELPLEQDTSPPLHCQCVKMADLCIHRITVLFELEGTLKVHLDQLPCSVQGHLQLDQVAQSPVQTNLNVSGGTQHPSGQPAPVPHATGSRSSDYFGEKKVRIQTIDTAYPIHD